MTFLVRAHIFSGRPDPVWAVSDDEVHTLLQREDTGTEALFEARGGGGLAMAAPISRGLGYRGFSLIETDQDHKFEQLLQAPDPEALLREAFIDDRPLLEAGLLDSAGSLIPKPVRDAIEASLKDEPPSPLEDVTGCPPCYGATAPDYDPAYWNDNPITLRNNNCYNYANNHATNTFAQPGRGTGQMYGSIDCPEVRAAAVRDGLKVAPNFGVETPGWYVALVIWPGYDYHWYRQDRNGCWSHKPGGTAARNYDNSGQPISDPQTCDRGPYTNFCSFMATDDGVQIR